MWQVAEQRRRRAGEACLPCFCGDGWPRGLPRGIEYQRQQRAASMPKLIESEFPLQCTWLGAGDGGAGLHGRRALHSGWRAANILKHSKRTVKEKLLARLAKASRGRLLRKK